MKLLLLSLAFGVASAIIGGNETNISQHPYQLSVENYMLDWAHYCGAVIIAENVALTSAQCAEKSSAGNLRLRAGTDKREEGGSVHLVNHISIHPDYDYAYLTNDVAALFIEDSFQLGATEAIIPLATVTPEAGTMAVLSGWGKIQNDDRDDPEHLYSVDIPIQDFFVCLGQMGVAFVDDDNICAGRIPGGLDFCGRDKGGPLVVDGELVGIASWNDARWGNGCGDKYRSGVYASTIYLRDWIVEQISLAPPPPKK